MTFYLSNALEKLILHLKENLTLSSTLFSNNIVIFPSKAMKEWVYLKLAEEKKNMTLGITPMYLDQALYFLRLNFFSPHNKKKSLSDIALILKIDERVENSSLHLAKSYAELFKKYGVYGKECLKQWEKKAENEQQQLWKEIFQEYSYPYHYFTNLQEKQEIDRETQIHLFGFNHLSHLHFSFFYTLSQKIKLFFYHLSPCKEFWSDISSDREANRFFAKKPLKEETRIAFEHYLEDRHPLLANLGKVGREFALLVEESELPCIEDYVESNEKTTLNILQNDLLLLTQTKHEHCDDSLQIHSSTTKHREIQNLSNTLMHLMKEKNIEPKDILVMAPDITLYAPYIPSYFPLFRIADLSQATQSEEIKGLWQLMNLHKKRWSAQALLDLFNHPLFKKKHNWSEETLSIFEQWVEKGEIRWGYNLDHVNQILQENHCETLFEDDGATWQAGLKRLYSYFTLYEEKDEMDINNAEELGELSCILETLFNELTQLYTKDEKFFSEWIEQLQQSYEKFFAFEDGLLFDKLECLKKEDLFLKKYRFEDVFLFIYETLSRETTTIHGNQLQSITFCSLHPMRAIPAKVICLIGMDSDSFPRKEKSFPPNILGQKGDYCPSKYDFDRYLFLEAILSAREYFIISYIGKSPYDQTSLPESSVILELQRYVNVKTIVHPEASFDPLYFQGIDRNLKSFSKSDYKAALSLLAPKSQKPFVHKSAESVIPVGKHTIYLKDLRRLFRYPVSFYLEKKFNIKFFEETKHKEEEEFKLCPSHIGSLRKLMMHTSAEEALKTLEKRGGLPLADFKKLALFRLKKENEYLPTFPTLTLKLSSYEKKKKETLSLVSAPPVNFKFDDEREIQFVGTIDNVSESGLFVFENETLTAAVRHFSDFLILHKVEGIGKNLFFGKDKTHKETFISDLDNTLKRVVEYYFYAHNNPSFLIPEYIEPLLKQDSEVIEELMLEAKSYDEGVSWIAEKVGAHVQESDFMWSEKLFKEMKNVWF